MKRFYFILLLQCIFFSNAFASDSPAGVGVAKTASSSTISASIIKVAEDRKSIEVDEPNKSQGLVLPVNKELQDQLNQGLILSQGDKVTLEVDEKNTITSIKPDKTVPVSGQSRLLYLLGSAIFLLIFSSIALGLAGGGNILSLIVGEDNRYSNSKFQIALWFFIVIATYLAVIILRWCNAGGEYLQVNIPQNLLLLSGMSVLTFCGAKAITSSKSDPKATQEAADAVAKADAAATAVTDANKKAANPDGVNTNAQANLLAEKISTQVNARDKSVIAGYNAGKPNFFKDLLQNDFGKVDFGDFQMLVVTMLAVGVYFLQVYTFMGHVDIVRAVTLPGVDTTILSAFGLGHGAYLTKKYAGETGES